MASAEMFNLPNHYSVMRNAFKAMVLNGDYVDVTIWCDRQPIRAHKCILAAASDYFHRIFQDLARQQPQQSHAVIAIQNVRPDDLLAVIKYVYDGQMRVPEMRVNTFMATAQMLGVDVARTVADVDRDDESGVHSESTGSPPGLDVLQQAFKAAAAIPEIARGEHAQCFAVLLLVLIRFWLFFLLFFCSGEITGASGCGISVCGTTKAKTEYHEGDTI